MPKQSTINKVKHKVSEEQQVNVTLLGDSTIDNRIWVDGFIKSYFYTRLGIKREEASVRVQKSHRFIGKPDLSVVENVMDMLPNYAINDFTNDGFTTRDVLYGASRDKVFGHGTFSLFPEEYFQPLQEGVESIKKSQHIIVSIGGNDFREFLMAAIRMKGETRTKYVRENLNPVLERMRDQYIAILEKINALNRDAQIILMTQYYPSVTQNNYEIYPFMKEIGKILNLGGMFHNPMTVIHDLMKMTYTDVLKRVPRGNTVVADITSSLNPYISKNYVSQIEPSGLGGKKIAQMLKYIMTSNKVVSGQVYRFYPAFFTTEEQDKHVEGCDFNQWLPAHPYDLREGYTLEEEKIFHKYHANQLDRDVLLEQLNQSIEKLDASSPMYKTALAVRREGESLSHVMFESDIKKWKMSIVLAINVLDTQKDNPDYPNAVRLLKSNADHRAIGKTDGWNKFKGALAMLAGAGIIELSIAGIPFSGGASMIGLPIFGGLLSTGGVAFFYHNRQKSLSKESSSLAKEASKQLSA